jgi:sodium transport system permease protein
VEVKAEIDRWFKVSPVQVLIVVPAEFKATLDEINARLEAREPINDLVQSMPRPVILQNSANEKSMIAARRVREAVRNWERQALQQRLQAASLPAELPQVVDATSVDLAAQEEISATLWSKLFPTLLVMMAVTGAFYPAIDLGAGEKERGTMETLLISPATRTEIVTGKFLTVMLFSLCTALLNLLSMGVTSKYFLTMAAASGAGGSIGRMGGVGAFPDPSVLVWVVLVAIPLSALFSALSLALAMFAKSSKEGQYYLTPLLMVTMGLTMFCLSPSVEINPFYSVYPVVGPGLLLKALLLSQPQPHLPAYIAAVMVSSFSYSALALWWAIEQFKSEDVLFREAERFELGAWMRHIFRDREPTPSFTEAGFCFVMILMLQFLSQGFLAKALIGNNSPMEMLKVQTIYLLVVVATPALLMAAMLTRSARKTLKLYWPGWKMLGVAVVLAATLYPLSNELLSRLDWFFPPPPEGVQKMLGSLNDPSIPWWLPLLALAVAPAVCEELAFRGFILSGLQRARSPWAPILLSAVAFGIIHLIPQQVFNGMLLGVVIGLMAVNSRSLYPCILFHFLFNGTHVLLQRIGAERVGQFAQRSPDWLFAVQKSPAGELTGVSFGWPVLLVCLLVSGALITWLARSLGGRYADYKGEERRAGLTTTHLRAIQSGT